MNSKIFSAYLLCTSYLCGILFDKTSGEDENVLVTKLGSLRGRITQQDSTTLYSYFNIPYAKPPIGSLRFKDPRSFGEWDGVRDGTKCGNVCPQDVAVLSQMKSFGEIYERSPAQSEDCLSLNVMVPGKPKDKRLRSVMVWIHGGAYTIGDGCGYDGSYLASGGDVIVVTFNYRIGALGFFSTADSNMPGNYGLKDQRLALMWVHENIRDYGGDPDSVTIFGESAGSFSVSLMSLIPENKGLFHKAILQSGSADLSPVIEQNPRQVALVVAKELKCENEDSTVDDMDSKHILACLVDKPWESIVNVQTSAPVKAGMKHMLSSAFYPTIDGKMIKKHPHDILMESSSPEIEFFRSLDVIAGTCDLEGALVAAGMVEHVKSQMNIPKDVIGAPYSLVCDAILPSVAAGMLGNINTKDLLCESIKSESPIVVGQKFVELCGDIMFVAPTVNTLNKHATNNAKSKTYQYLFTLEAFNGIQGDRLDYLKGRGSDHSTDIFPLFGKDYGYGAFKDRFPYDISDLQRSMVSYWTNFAKNSDPNGEGFTNWPQYSTDTKLYVNLNKESVTLGDNIHKDNIKLLIETIPNQSKEQPKTEL